MRCNSSCYVVCMCDALHTRHRVWCCVSNLLIQPAISITVQGSEKTLRALQGAFCSHFSMKLWALVVVVISTQLSADAAALPTADYVRTYNRDTLPLSALQPRGDASAEQIKLVFDGKNSMKVSYLTPEATETKATRNRADRR
jgi:hypothetical protein